MRMTVISTSELNMKEKMGAGVWPEFTHSMCSQLNRERCLVVAAPPETSACICRCVDNAFAKLLPSNGDDTKESSLLALQKAPRACFRTDENIAKLQRCTAVYGRVPMLAVLEMDKDRTFVLDFNDDTTGEEDVEAFLIGVASNSIAKALQGAPPPLHDRFEPTHGVTLKHGLCAVTSTFARLKQKEPGGALCAFWSDRCSICPAVLELLDRVVGLVWDAARRHGVVRTFSYIVCNIDDNELPEQDWPELQHQVVPTIVAYNNRGDRIVYEDGRTVPLLVSFVCRHCLPRDLCDADHILSDAILCAEETRNGDDDGKKKFVVEKNTTRDGSHKDLAESAERKRHRCSSPEKFFNGDVKKGDVLQEQ